MLCNTALLDGANRFGVTFGRARMSETLRNLDDLSAVSVCAAVAGALGEHAGGAAMDHDRLCVAVRVRA